MGCARIGMLSLVSSDLRREPLQKCDSQTARKGFVFSRGESHQVRCDCAHRVFRVGPLRWRAAGRTAPNGGQVPERDRGTLPNFQSSASPLLLSLCAGRERAFGAQWRTSTTRRTRKWSALSPPPTSSPTISTSAPSPLPTAAIDLTSDISPPASLSMVASATSGHVQATQSLALPQLPAFHLPAAAPPSHFMRCM